MACFMTAEVSVGCMMGQAFSLRVLFRLQPKAAAAKATLPWVRMHEALGLAGKTEGLMGMKAVGFQNHRGAGRRKRSCARRLAGVNPAAGMATCRA